MIIETIRSDLMQRLSVHFTVNAVKSYTVDPRDFRVPSLRAKQVLAFEFIINSAERYITFAIELPHGVVFTRPKEGIVKHLVSTVREHDFYFKLSDSVYDRYDLVGRLIENWINVSACASMHSLLQKWSERSGNDFDYCLGYKITQHHKQTMTFDAEMEVLVDKGTGDYIPFTLLLRNGVPHKISCNGSEVNNLSDLFGHWTPL